MSFEQPRLSFVEKLDLVPAFLSIGIAAVVAVIEWPLSSSAKADRYYHHVVHSIVRQFSRRLSVSQAQWIEAPFLTTYQKWCRKHNAPARTVDISSRTKGFWLGDTSAEYVMIYLHGGGFVFPGNVGHLDFWHSVQEFLESKQISLEILFVAYPLTPRDLFPSQLEEAVNALRYTLEILELSPSQIILAGDSAGGNLAMATLLQATHPTDLVASSLEALKSEKLKAVVLMSPWMNFDVSLPSFSRNRSRDYLEARSEKRWSDLYVGVHTCSAHSEPAVAHDSLWKGLPAQEVLVTSGSHEVLLDGIDQWVRDLKVYNSNVTYKVAIGEPHEAPIIWSIFGDRCETETGRNIKEWLTAVL